MLSFIETKQRQLGSFRNNYMNDDNKESSVKLNKGFEEFGNAVHSVVKVHPISSKKFLYINPSFTSQIVGMTTTDSNNLLSYLFNFMCKPNFTPFQFSFPSEFL